MQKLKEIITLIICIIVLLIVYIGSRSQQESYILSVQPYQFKNIDNDGILIAEEMPVPNLFFENELVTFKISTLVLDGLSKYKDVKVIGLRVVDTQVIYVPEEDGSIKEFMIEKANLIDKKSIRVEYRVMKR